MSSNWKLFGTGDAGTFENYKTTWGLTNSTVYQYIYDLSGGQVANGTNLTENNWKQYDTTSNPTLSANTGYWVRVDESALSPGIYVNSSNGEVKLIYNVPEGTNNVSITNFTWEGTNIVNTIYDATVTTLTGLTTDHIDSASYTDGSNPFLSQDGFTVKPATSGFGGGSPAAFKGGSGASPGYLETGENIIFKLENVITSVPDNWELRLSTTETFTQDSNDFVFTIQ